MMHAPENGQHCYYSIQHKVVKQSKWLDVKGEMHNVDKEWHNSSFDHFGFDGEHNVWEKTGDKGWWKLKDAQKTLKVAQKRDAAGEFDYTDTYNKKCQLVRHEFRIIKVEVIYYRKQEPVCIAS